MFFSVFILSVSISVFISLLSSVIGAIRAKRLGVMYCFDSIAFFVRGDMLLLGDLMRLFESMCCQSNSLSEPSVENDNSVACLIGFVITSGDKHVFVLLIVLLGDSVLELMAWWDGPWPRVAADGQRGGVDERYVNLIF